MYTCVGCTFELERRPRPRHLLAEPLGGVVVGLGVAAGAGVGEARVEARHLRAQPQHRQPVRVELTDRRRELVERLGALRHEGPLELDELDGALVVADAPLLLVPGDRVLPLLERLPRRRHAAAEHVLLRRVEVREEVAQEGRLAEARLAGAQQVERLEVLEVERVARHVEVVGLARHELLRHARPQPRGSLGRGVGAIVARFRRCGLAGIVLVPHRR